MFFGLWRELHILRCRARNQTYNLPWCEAAAPVLQYLAIIQQLIKVVVVSLELLYVVIKEWRDEVSVWQHGTRVRTVQQIVACWTTLAANSFTALTLVQDYQRAWKKTKNSVLGLILMKQLSGYGCICELWKLLWCNRWMEQLLTDSCSAVWRRSVNKRHGSSFRHSLVTLAWFCSSWCCGYSVCLGIYRRHTAPPVHCSRHYTAWKALAYTQVDTWNKWQISGGAELIWTWASVASWASVLK